MAYTKATVTSADGTTIGFCQLGSGPGVVILHGGALASRDYMELATALADDFTVYVPDRRGRGMSGPYGPRYCIEREDEDLRAIVAATGARNVFGTADGGLFALHAAMRIPVLRRVAVFEPVLFVGQPGLDTFRETISRARRLVAAGDLAAAMASLAKDAADGDVRTRAVAAPYRVLGSLMARPLVCRMLLWADARTARGGRDAMADMIPALIPELEQVEATEGTIEDYRAVIAEVLLMCGTGAPPLFTGTRDALLGVLPTATAVDLPGLNHGAAQDQGGRPAVIAEQLRQFFRAES